MDRLSPLSAAFLSAEDVDPEQLHWSSARSPSCSGPAPALDEVRARSSSGSTSRRATASGSGAPSSTSGPPVWEDDPDFDLARHVRRDGAPAPGGEHEVAELVGRMMAARMDRDRPLWDITVCDGLEGGRWGAAVPGATTPSPTASRAPRCCASLRPSRRSRAPRSRRRPRAGSRLRRLDRGGALARHGAGSRSDRRSCSRAGPLGLRSDRAEASLCLGQRSP